MTTSKRKRLDDLGESLQVEYSRDAIATMQRDVAHRAHRVRMRRRTAKIATATAAAAVVLWALWPGGVPEQSSAPPTFAQGTLSFPDGSLAEPLSETSRLSLKSSTDDEVRVALERGEGHFRITPNRSRRFVVEAGQAEVVVLGTEFRVTYRPPEVIVEVTHGRVALQLGDTQKILTAGQRGSLSEDDAAAQRAHHEARRAARGRSLAVLERSTTIAAAEEVVAAPTTAPKRTKRAPDWRKLAERGKYAEAKRALRRRAKRVAGPRELMLAADTMRLTGQPRDAIGYLDTLISKYPRDAREPLAQFTKARILLQQLRQPRRAAPIFANLAERRIKGSIPQDALAREVEAWHRAGDKARARERAQTYVRRYPRGHRLGSVKRFGGLRP